MRLFYITRSADVILVLSMSLFEILILILTTVVHIVLTDIKSTNISKANNQQVNDLKPSYIQCTLATET